MKAGEGTPAAHAPALELGLSTSILGFRALPQGLAAIEAHGVRWVEIHGYTADEFDFTDAALVDATRRALGERGLRLWACHSPAYKPLDVASEDAELRRHSCAVMAQAMRASADLGARVFVCDAARPHRDDTPAQASERRGFYADSLRGLLDRAHDLGVHLAIENQPRGGARFVFPEDFTRLQADYGLTGLGACWDTGHGWIAGLGPEVACRLGDRLATLHVHDNDGQRDRHLLPTTGTISWAPFMRCLRRLPYSGPFMMELVPGSSERAAVERALAEAVSVYDRLIRLGRDGTPEGAF